MLSHCQDNLEQLIGGATEETIIAHVGDIISAIGSATLHSDVLQNPGMITKAVSARSGFANRF